LAAEDSGTHREAAAVAALRNVARGALCGQGRGVKFWGEFAPWQESKDFESVEQNMRTSFIILCIIT
jgi:hypothetical protein